MSNLTSTLTVHLTDDVSGPASRAAGALHKLGASGADLKKLAAAGTGKLSADLERLQQSAGKLGVLRDATRQLGASGTDFRAARQNVGQLTTALSKADTKLQALKGVRGAEGQRQEAAREVQGLKRELRAATAIMGESRAAYLEQGRAVRGLQVDAKGAGLSLRNLHQVEAQLGEATKRTNASLAMRSAMLGAGGKLSRGLQAGAGGVDALAARMAEGDHRRQAAGRDRAASARMIDGMGATGRSVREQSEAIETARAARMEKRATRRAARAEAAGTVGAAAGVAVGHAVKHGAHASLETYREFDRERRFGKAVMGLSDAEQAPLVDQAVHMGATTRYNDIAVLEAQRELSARGLKKDQVMGLMEPAANLGQALDLKLPDAVKQMEGAIFGFKKDISTVDAARKSATQTADLQVKAAKISGMTPEDITQTYKYGATPARMAGLSEETLLAFAGISKKANMGGDEAGVAFRALVATAMSPTRGAKEAMLANGMDYKNYQKTPEAIDTAAFTKTVAAQYGVKLDKITTAGLQKIFTDRSLIADPAKFTPAVTKLLGDNLGGDDAKSKKSIAGLANRFRDKSMKGVDSDRLVADLMEAIPKNPALANAIFGSKQGARIGNALGDPETFRKMLKDLIEHSAGYSKDVSDQRMEGFDGAVWRLTGALKNLESKTGRAWDNDGDRGLLTRGTDLAARAIQGVADLDNKAVLAGTALMALAATTGSVAGSLRISGMLLGLPALTALGGMAAAIGGVTLAAGAAAAALYGLSNEKKGLIHGGKPDVTMNPSDELPGLPGSSDLPSWVPKSNAASLPRMSLRDGVPSLVEASKEALPANLAKAREEAAGLRKELDEAKSIAAGMSGMGVPGLDGEARGKVAALERQVREAEGRYTALKAESSGRQPAASPGAAQPASRAAEGVPSLIDAPRKANAGAIAKAREDLAVLAREYATLQSEMAGHSGLDLPGLSSGLEARKAQIETLMQGLQDKIRTLGETPIAPKADLSGLDPLNAKFGEIKDKGAEVNALVIRPQADGSGLGTIIQQLQTALSLVGQLNAATTRVSMPSSSTVSGNTGRVRATQGNNH